MNIMNGKRKLIISEENKVFYRKVFALVLPMALQNMINVGITGADVIMLGKAGETALAGASLAGQVQFVMNLIFFGLTSGAAVLTAQYWGKQDMRAIEKVMSIALRLSLIVGLIFTIAAMAVPEALLRIFTSEPPVIAEGVKYLRIVSFSYILTSITMTYLNILRSVERVFISTVVYLLSLLTNVILNAILIFGYLGFPAMGVEGAATATLIARILELVIVIVYAFRMNDIVKIRFRDFIAIDRTLFWDFMIFSLPVVVNELMWGAGVSANAAIIGHLGSSAVAANSIAQVIKQLAMVVSFGISTATAILLGKAIGERKFEEAKVYAEKLRRLSIVFGLIGACVVLAIRPLLVSNMSISGQAKSYLGFMLFVMAYFVMAQAYNCTLIVGVFRAGGDTRYGLFLDVAFMWGFSIIFGFLAAFVFKWGVLAVYVILMCDELIKIPVATRRYRSMKWLRNVTR